MLSSVVALHFNNTPTPILQTRAVTPSFLPAHMARLSEQEKAGTAALATVIDIVLLARAKCLVASDSGFSETAWLLGGGRGCLLRLKDKSCGRVVPRDK